MIASSVPKVNMAFLRKIQVVEIAWWRSVDPFIIAEYLAGRKARIEPEIEDFAVLLDGNEAEKKS